MSGSDINALVLMIRFFKKADYSEFPIHQTPVHDRLCTGQYGLTNNTPAASKHGLIWAMNWFLAFELANNAPIIKQNNRSNITLNRLEAVDKVTYTRRYHRPCV